MLLSLAKSLEAEGKASEAETHLRRYLKQECPRSRWLWERWLRLAWNELGRSPEEVLKEFPCEPQADGTYVSDIHWLLERLVHGETVRINCGGDRYEAADGVVWEGDRFARGGQLFNPKLEFGFATAPTDGMEKSSREIAGTEDDALYQTERHFILPSFPVGYRIPLPSSDYRLTLHFAEIYFDEPGKRRFDVRVEDKVVLGDYELCDGAVSTACRQLVDTSVKDGLLEIGFVAGVGYPKLSAIEIERRP